MIKKKIIYFSILLFVVNLVIYINLANAFIYFRIGEGGLTNPLLVSTSNMIEGTGAKIKYVALGDSLTAGVGADTFKEIYPYLIAKKINETDGSNVTLENFSAPGAKTQDLINVLLEPAVKSKPDIITLLIGVNDIHNHIGLEQFKKNYQVILDRLTKETSAKIYLINIPRIGSNTIILPPLNFYFDVETDRYNEVIKELAKTYNLTYIDLNSPTKDLLKKDGAHYSVDSFHPSAVGYKLWAQIIYDRFNR